MRAALLVLLAAAPLLAQTITSMPREPDAFDFPTAKGTVRILIDKSGRIARAKIHAERRVKLYGGDSLENAQKLVNGAAQPGASVFIGFAHGAFVGCNKMVDGRMRIYEYTLDDDGLTKTVMMSGGEYGGKNAVFVRALGADGAERFRVVATYDDSFLLKPEAKIPSR